MAGYEPERTNEWLQAMYMAATSKKDFKSAIKQVLGGAPEPEEKKEEPKPKAEKQKPTKTKEKEREKEKSKPKHEEPTSEPKQTHRITKIYR